MNFDVNCWGFYIKIYCWFKLCVCVGVFMCNEMKGGEFNDVYENDGFVMDEMMEWYL